MVPTGSGPDIIVGAWRRTNFLYIVPQAFGYNAIAAFSSVKYVSCSHAVRSSNSPFPGMGNEEAAASRKVNAVMAENKLEVIMLLWDQGRVRTL